MLAVWAEMGFTDVAKRLKENGVRFFNGSAGVVQALIRGDIVAAAVIEAIAAIPEPQKTSEILVAVPDPGIAAEVAARLPAWGVPVTAPPGRSAADSPLGALVADLLRKYSKAVLIAVIGFTLVGLLLGMHRGWHPKPADTKGEGSVRRVRLGRLGQRNL